MRIANTVSDSIVDGPGLRFTVFTQGCPHRCPGCHNPGTHDPAGGREVSVAELAAELALPVIVHDREAHQDCLEVVRAHPEVLGVYHCYSGSLEDAKVLVKLGWMLSFTGVITYKNARKALEVIEWLPMDRIMVETDSPYLTPEPFRGKRNDSGKVHLVAEAIARVKGMDPEEAARITLENGTRFFRIEI